MADMRKTKAARAPKEQKNENIQVFVRVRPQNAQEKQEKHGRSANVIDCNKDREIIVKERTNSSLTKTFTFDRVFGPDSKQLDVYKTVVNPLIDEVLAGYNCTVFAYGQTGTGKTFTMEGERSSEDVSWEKDPQCGIIPRVLSHIFDELRMQQLEFTMGVSYLELYNEELIDLLSPIDDTTKLRLFEDASQKGSLVIQGLQEILVLDKKEVYEIMNKGSQKRQTAATLMNAHSSRSHTIFTVTVHIRESTDDGEELLRTGKINLVDLAGSENIGRSGAKQQRAREAGNINQSLLTLGRVITALVERTPHIPYRESKLTRLLQDSLGGRTKTSIIATVSPVVANLEETLSTLDYAHRAKSITNRPEINQRLTKKALLKEYTTEIERLRRDLEATRDGTGVFLAHDNYVQMTSRLEKQDDEIAENIQRIRALEEERDKKESICDRLNMELELKVSELVSTTETLEATRGTLEVTQGTLDVTRVELQRKEGDLLRTEEQLKITEEEREERGALLESHVATERELGAQAATLLAVADQSTVDLQQVHDKLDRKRSVEDHNAEAVREFRETFVQRLARMRENTETFTDEQGRQLSEIRNKLGEALQSSRNIELSAHSQASSFLESHGRSVQVLEKELHDQADARQHWSQAQMQAVRENTDTQTAALHAALTQAYAKVTDLQQQVEQLKGGTATSVKTALQQLEAQERGLQEFRLQQVESIVGVTQQVMSFSQRMTAVLQQHHNQVATLLEHRDSVYQVERQNMDKVAELLQLIQKNDKWLQSKKEEESIYFQKISDITKSQAEIVKDHVSTMETQLNELDTQGNALGRAQEEAAVNISKSVKSLGKEVCLSLDDMVVAHKGLASDMSAVEIMVERGWQDHSASLEDQLRSHAEGAHADLQAQATHIEDLKAMALRQAEEQATFAEARQTSLTGFLEAGQLELSEQGAAAHQWGSQHGRDMYERAQEVQNFLVQGIKQDQPTGNTPQRRVMEFPRVLKATSPHERILKRFRTARLQQQQRPPIRCPSMDSVLVGSSGDENSMSRSTSLSSLSTPSSPEEEVQQNKENGSMNFLNPANIKTKSQKSPISNKNKQILANKSGRTVLANQN